MKPSRLLLLSASIALLPGCVGYTKFRATNPRGEMIAEWTGRGGFYPVSGGYQITAVERISGPPLMIESHYPHGRRSVVTGAHIERWHTHRPLWMDEFDSHQLHTQEFTPETTYKTTVQLPRSEVGS